MRTVALLASIAMPIAMMAQAFNPTSFSIAFVADETPGSETQVTSNLIVDLSTDKACYSPGQTVAFAASSKPANARVRYRHGSTVVDDKPMTAKTWTWTAPAEDFKGYMVEVYEPTSGGDNILGTIAVDVSSDWTRYPRYGFVATFDRSKLNPGVIEGEMAYLNRCHINGVQFQDWHYKHHWPLGGTRDNLMDEYTDIAMRVNNTAAVKKYIDKQHAYGMKSIFYNLCFGALDDAHADGVSDRWYIFRDNHRGQRDYHGLPQGWKSDIFLVNPANTQWQSYIGDRNDDVYASLDFDGYQIDQLGGRGEVYDYNGNRVDLPSGYASFINAMKQRHPSKRLIMNAVGSFGADKILGTGKVDFAYNEPWGDEAQFTDLYNIIKANDNYSGGKVRTVFAAYMNYDKAWREEGGTLNTPGVLLTDAVMMALGGDHLELGDHMLSREYFPAAPLAMTDELRTAMIRYYDFMTAYENLLRDGTTADEVAPGIASLDPSVTVTAWPPQPNTVTAYARNVGGKKVVHLLNFLGQTDMSWRDLDGTRPVSIELSTLPIKIAVPSGVSNIWVASPDYHGGALVPVPFKVEGGYATISVPGLKYWTMLVIE